MIQISTSILSSNDRINCVKELNNTNTDYIHIDVMDGKFVNNKQFSIKEIKELSIISNKRLDIHLMVKDIYKYVDMYQELNPEYIIFQSHIRSLLFHMLFVRCHENDPFPIGDHFIVLIVDADTESNDAASGLSGKAHFDRRFSSVSPPALEIHYKTSPTRRAATTADEL